MLSSKHQLKIWPKRKQFHSQSTCTFEEKLDNFHHFFPDFLRVSQIAGHISRLCQEFKTLYEPCSYTNRKFESKWSFFREARRVPVSLWISSKNFAFFPSVFRPSDSIASWLCTVADNKIFPSTSSLSKLFAIASHLNLSSAHVLTSVISQSKKTSDKHE